MKNWNTRDKIHLINFITNNSIFIYFVKIKFLWIFILLEKLIKKCNCVIINEWDHHKWSLYRIIKMSPNSKNANFELNRGEVLMRFHSSVIKKKKKKTLFHEHLDARPCSINDDSVMEIVCGWSNKELSYGRYRRITQTSEKSIISNMECGY